MRSAGTVPLPFQAVGFSAENAAVLAPIPVALALIPPIGPAASTPKKNPFENLIGYRQFPKSGYSPSNLVFFLDAEHSRPQLRVAFLTGSPDEDAMVM